MENKYFKALKEANEMLRSCHSVIERKGVETNWDSLEKKVKDILKKQAEFNLYDNGEDLKSQQRKRRPSGLICGCCLNPILKHDSIYCQKCVDSDDGDF